jgi:alpha-beta hydrolase superfamily lysophospholipase
MSPRARDRYPRDQYQYPPELYGGAPPSVAAETSREAARTIAGDTSALRRRVYAAIAAAMPTGLTDEAISEICQMRPNTARPRRIELVALGAVKDSGRRARVASGQRAALWVTTT